MIVIAMIAMFVSMSVLPYNYYMDRARVEKTLDTLSQEWIVAHQKIRSWLLHPGSSSHAHMYVDIKKWAQEIVFSTSTGSIAERKEYKKYAFDKNIAILGWSGAVDTSVTEMVYHISPPLARGMFSTGSLDESSLTGIILHVGYLGASVTSGRVRDILLRPYFD